MALIGQYFMKILNQTVKYGTKSSLTAAIKHNILTTIYYAAWCSVIYVVWALGFSLCEFKPCLINNI